MVQLLVLEWLYVIVVVFIALLMECGCCLLSAVALNDGHLFDVIFSDEYIMDIVGALECKHMILSLHQFCHSPT